MSERKSTRRRIIRTAGVAALVGLAGCSSGSESATTGTETESTTGTATATASSTATRTSTTTESGSNSLRGPRNGDDLPKDTTPDDGYPPAFQTVPKERAVDPAQFEALERSGFEIKLVPTDVAYYWYARGEARFADARSESEFDVSHVFGSVLSPAGDGRDLPDDPVLRWPKGDRIITYCDCPHHLSSLRAASLMNRGYEEVYALDQGFSAWREHNFPLSGSDIGRVPPVRTIEGKAPTQYAGKTAWAYHTDSNQREATEIAADGSYTLETKFVDVTDQSTVRVETPAYSLTASLGELTSGTIAADGTLSGTAGTTSNTTSTTTTSNTTETSSGLTDLRLFRR